MDYKCSFLTDKDNIGPVCISSFVVGLVISLTVGLKFLHHKQEDRNYESVQMHPVPTLATSSNSNITSYSLPNVRGCRNETQRTRQRNENPRGRFQGTSYANENDTYLDPVPYRRDSNYLTPSQGLGSDNMPYQNEQTFVSAVRYEQKKTTSHRTVEYTNHPRHLVDIPKTKAGDDYLESYV